MKIDRKSINKNLKRKKTAKGIGSYQKSWQLYILSIPCESNTGIRQEEIYPNNRGFKFHAKNGEKRKTSEEIVSKSYWACAISRPGVWTSHTGQTGCVAGFSTLRHSRAWTVCISAGQNSARLIKWQEKRFGSSLVLKLYCVILHAYHSILNRILTRFLQRFFFSLHFSRARKNLRYQGRRNAYSLGEFISVLTWLTTLCAVYT